MVGGGVRIVKTDGRNPDESETCEIVADMDAGSFASVVLTMSHFNERPGDWHKWMDHHMGRHDLLE